MCLGRCKRVWEISSSRYLDCKFTSPFYYCAGSRSKFCRCDENTSTLTYFIDQSKVKINLDVDSGMLIDG